MPVAEAWGDTALELPNLDGAGLDNLLTGATVTVTAGAVPMAEIFSTLPLAAFLLRGGR